MLLSSRIIECFSNERREYLCPDKSTRFLRNENSKRFLRKERGHSRRGENRLPNKSFRLASTVTRRRGCTSREYTWNFCSRRICRLLMALLRLRIRGQATCSVHVLPRKARQQKKLPTSSTPTGNGEGTRSSMGPVR